MCLFSKKEGEMKREIEKVRKYKYYIRVPVSWNVCRVAPGQTMFLKDLLHKPRKNVLSKDMGLFLHMKDLYFLFLFSKMSFFWRFSNETFFKENSIVDEHEQTQKMFLQMFLSQYVKQRVGMLKCFHYIEHLVSTIMVMLSAGECEYSPFLDKYRCWENSSAQNNCCQYTDNS